MNLAHLRKVDTHSNVELRRILDKHAALFVPGLGTKQEACHTQVLRIPPGSIFDT